MGARRNDEWFRRIEAHESSLLWGFWSLGRFRAVHAISIGVVGVVLIVIWVRSGSPAALMGLALAATGASVLRFLHASTFVRASWALLEEVDAAPDSAERRVLRRAASVCRDYVEVERNWGVVLLVLAGLALAVRQALNDRGHR